MPKVARTILLDTMGSLGLKHGRQGSLLELGVRLRARDLVAHDLSQVQTGRV